MADIVKALYNAAFFIWNNLIGVAMTLFTTSPKAAGGGSPYAMARTFYNAIADATVPIATVFFIIAIYKTVVTSPPEQQAQRFLMDALKYCIILFIAANMWKIMGYIIDFSDGITTKFGSTGTYTLSMGGDLEQTIDDTLTWPSFSLSGEYIKEVMTTIGCSFLFMIGGLVLIVIMVACSLSIISSAFQRILKPLVILPFAGIAVALGAGSQDISRSLMQYIKTFFGFCISGALMVIEIKVGISLVTNLVSFSLSESGDIQRVILITVQAAITPIVLAGLVKGTDSVISRMF